MTTRLLLLTSVLLAACNHEHGLGRFDSALDAGQTSMPDGNPTAIDTAVPSVDASKPSNDALTPDPSTPTPSAPLATLSALAQCHIQTTGTSTVWQDTVPYPLDARWFFYDQACNAGGWELSKCSGAVTFSKWPTDRSGLTGPVVAVAITNADSVCCVYQYEDASLAGAATMLPTACGPAFPAMVAFEQCDVRPSNELRVGAQQVFVPSVPADNSIWAPRATACAQGGYDLSRCAGREATLSCMADVRKDDSVKQPSTACALIQDGALCCLWESDSSSPPVLSAKSCPKALNRPDGCSCVGSDACGSHFRNAMTALFNSCPSSACGSLTVDIDANGMATPASAQPNMNGGQPVPAEELRCLADVLNSKQWPCLASTTQSLFIASCTLM